MKKAMELSAFEKKPAEVYDYVTGKSPPQYIEQLPKRSSVMENLRRFKEKNHPLPKAPKQRCGFEIPPEFSHAIIGQEVRPTLVYDSGKDDKDRILVW
ncbi:hypothetical protein Pmar_PMAR026677, partial [Perkinsus marinus ATCC 50983]